MSGVEDPWSLLGEGIAVFVKRPRRNQRVSLPNGFRRLPGRTVLLAERLDHSPVGPFVVLTVLEPVVSKWRFGLYATTTVVSSDAARRVMRTRWGLPAEVGGLGWHSEAEAKSFAWSDDDLVVTAVNVRRRWPIFLPTRVFQQAGRDLSVFPARLRAMVRSARVVIEVPESSRLGGFAGVHRGVVLSGLNMKIGQAEIKRARVLGVERGRATEPGLLGMSDGPFND